MARKFIRRWIPDQNSVRDIPALRFLGNLLHDPNLFHLNRHSVSVAVFVGVFVGFLPIIGQMPLAACLALLFRCNLPLSVALVWISNPLTFAPLFYTTYEIGRWILDMPRASLQPEWTWEWVSAEIDHIWKPLLTGSVLSGLIVGALGYFAMRAFWYWTVSHSWSKRRKDRLRRQQEQ